MGRDSRGHYIKINSLIPLAKVWLSYRRAYRSTQAPEGGWEVEQSERGRGCKQARPYGTYTQTTHTCATAKRMSKTDTRRTEEKRNERGNKRGDISGGRRGTRVGVFPRRHTGTGVYARHPQKRTL